MSLFGEYSTDTVIKKLVPVANSQRNESLKSVVGSKNLKIRYYGGSESNDFRVSCSVSQTNLGYSYIPRTLECLNIERGIFCSEFNCKMDKKSDMHKCRKSSVEFKRRRSQLNKLKISDAARKEAKEGSTYESNIGLNLNSSKTQRELSATLTISELCAFDITKTEQENIKMQYQNTHSDHQLKRNISTTINFIILFCPTRRQIRQES